MKPYYADDSVTLYHGDCLEVTDWLTADVLVTDPPYGIAMRQRLGSATRWTSSRNQTELRGQLPGDLSPEVRDAALALWGERPAIVFGSWKIERPVGVKHRLIWHKAGSFSGLSREAFLSQDEEIYVLGSGYKRGGVPVRSVLTTTEHRAIAVQEAGHPTPKPVSLMQTLIDRCPDGLVSDPFTGSGSTLVAAKALGRKAIGVEIEERYCEIAARRLSQGVLDFEESA
jgi:site-specific DNA-methyltransferase (adenine-specific)